MLHLQSRAPSRVPSHGAARPPPHASAPLIVDLPPLSPKPPIYVDLPARRRSESRPRSSNGSGGRGGGVVGPGLSGGRGMFKRLIVACDGTFDFLFVEGG